MLIFLPFFTNKRVIYYFLLGLLNLIIVLILKSTFYMNPSENFKYFIFVVFLMICINSLYSKYLRKFQKKKEF
jgi:C4-dicarboxylate transporter